MKRSTLVWVFALGAKLIHLSEESMERRHLEHLPGQDDRFYSTLAQELRNSESVLLVGHPHFAEGTQSELSRMGHLMGDKIIGLVAVENPSDAELATLARQYFFPEI
jgi:phosphohistidine phosphatase SixA